MTTGVLLKVGARSPVFDCSTCKQPLTVWCILPASRHALVGVYTNSHNRVPSTRAVATSLLHAVLVRLTRYYLESCKELSTGKLVTSLPKIQTDLTSAFDNFLIPSYSYTISHVYVFVVRVLFNYTIVSD